MKHSPEPPDPALDVPLAELIKQATGVVVDQSRTARAYMGQTDGSQKRVWVMYGRRPKQSWVTVLYGFTSKAMVVKAGKLYFPDEGTGLKSCLWLEILPYPKDAVTCVPAPECRLRKATKVSGDRGRKVSGNHARTSRRS